MKSAISILTCAALVAGCSSTPKIEPPPDAAKSEVQRYSTEGGESPVGVIPDAHLRDEKRNKDLDLYIDYPTRGGPYPVIIFSHGFGGSKNGYIPLTTHWASSGYVVIKPTHADSGALRNALAEQREQNPDRKMRDALDAVETAWEKQTPKEWADRVRDITLVIDSLASLEERYPELRGRIDPARVGVAGHSYGAFTAMLASGVRSFAPGAMPWGDPRVKALIAMSPPGTSERLGLTKESFSNLKIPSLFMTGTEDKGLSEQETPEWRREAYEYSPPPDKFLVVIQGARHATFTGRPLPPREELIRAEQLPPTDPRRLDPDQRPRSATTMGDPLRERNLFGIIKIGSLAFADAFLKSETSGREYLERLSQAGAEVKMK